MRYASLLDITLAAPFLLASAFAQRPRSLEAEDFAGSVLICLFSPQNHRATEKPNCLSNPSPSGPCRFEVFSVSL